MSSARPSYLPWPCIELALTKQRNHIEAVVLSLPVVPVMVTTPQLLSLLSGRKWPTESISSNLMRLYLAVLFHVRSDDRWNAEGDAFRTIDKVLRSDQQKAYEECLGEQYLGGTGLDGVTSGAEGNAFTLAYLNAYEAAIAKTMHLFREPDAEGNLPVPSDEVLNLSAFGDDCPELRGLFTPGVLPDKLTKNLETEQEAVSTGRKMCAEAMMKQERDCGSTAQARDPPPGPNKPCRCGSGKKYKKCHRTEDQVADAERRHAVALIQKLMQNTEISDDAAEGGGGEEA